MAITIKQLASAVTLSTLAAASLCAPVAAQLGGGAQPGSTAGGVAPMNTAGGPAGATGLQGVTPAAIPVVPGFGGTSFFGQTAGFYPYYVYSQPGEQPAPIRVQEPTTFGTVPQQQGQNVNFIREWNQSQSGYARVIPRPEVREW